ncbi:MAG: transglycosylase SLT domain-containing protein, partial [Acidobacteriota bacterium]
MPSIRARDLVAGLVVLVTIASPAAAELAIFADGDFMKITAWRVDGDRVTLDLPSGGQLVVSTRRLARIVDDEIVDEPVPEEPPAATFSLRFDATTATVPDVPHGEAIYAAAERHGLSPTLVAAVVRAESAYQVDAVSVKGARGLMQLMPATAERFGVA